MKSIAVTSLLLASILLFSTGWSTATAAEVRLVSQNLNRFFDDRDDGNNEKVVSTKKYHERLNRLVKHISNRLSFPDVLALQEVENINVLQDVVALIRRKYAIEYQPILYEGNDVSGIDVGFLIKKSLTVKSAKALFIDHRYGNKDNTLFARPPLFIEVCTPSCVNIVNLHLRSMRGLRSPKKGRRVALKRRLQAETIARWIDSLQDEQPHAKLILLGDFNALTPSDRYVDSVGIIRGNPDLKKPRWKSRDLISRDLIDITRRVQAKKRYSFVYKRKKQQLDYILVSKTMNNSIRSVRFSAIDYKISDHAAVITDFSVEQ